ncbi:unnamed protein product [Closterium sp. NIES-64]|nr:unnamed protein product [Closterium sp. NIES-64]
MLGGSGESGEAKATSGHKRLNYGAIATGVAGGMTLHCCGERERRAPGASGVLLADPGAAGVLLADPGAAGVLLADPGAAEVDARPTGTGVWLPLPALLTTRSWSSKATLASRGQQSNWEVSFPSPSLLVILLFTDFVHLSVCREVRGTTAAVRGSGEQWDDARPAATRRPPTRPADHPLCSRRALRARRRGGGTSAEVECGVEWRRHFSRGGGTLGEDAARLARGEAEEREGVDDGLDEGMHDWDAVGMRNGEQRLECEAERVGPPLVSPHGGPAHRCSTSSFLSTALHAPPLPALTPNLTCTPFPQLPTVKGGARGVYSTEGREALQVSIRGGGTSARDMQQRRRGAAGGGGGGEQEQSPLLFSVDMLNMRGGALK